MTDARTLRAFTHPLRISLMEALRGHGPLTATQAAEIVGDSPSNCSFHLRSLASVGVVEECASPDGRQRPWRLVKGSISFGQDGSPESQLAMATAVEVLHGNAIKGLSRWIQQAEEAPEEWREAWFDSNLTIAVTAEELTRIRRQLTAILKPYTDRRQARSDLPGEVPVRITTYGYPIRITTEEPPSDHRH